MTTKLIYSTYFGPIEYYSNIVQSDNIIFEVEENFQKQSYRNRCYIYGANGKLNLNVPVSHKENIIGRKKIKDMTIANEFNWQKLHWKSIESAYRTSPFFEYYEDELIPLFEKKHKYLLDLNLETYNIIKDLLQEDWKTSKTKEYINKPEGIIDLREGFNAKREPNTNFPEYTQVFSDKLGFIPNLSILDLLFMEGTNTENYLRKIDLSM